MSTAAATVSGIRFSDITGQKVYRANLPADSTVAEILATILDRIGLARADREGRPLTFRPRLERESRHLDGGELVGEALQPDDEIVLAPSIHAGRA